MWSSCECQAIRAPDLEAKQERALLAYITDSARRMEGQQHISYGIDKSRLCGLQIANGVIALPSGDAFFAPPQVALRGRLRVSETRGVCFSDFPGLSG